MISTPRPLAWAQQACESLMTRYLSLELPPAETWHYHQGVFLLGVASVWELTREMRYYDYVKGYVDGLVDASGNLVFAHTELDAIMPGLLLFILYERTQDERYRRAIDNLAGILDTMPRNIEGGFWHKEKYPDQQWLDGLYMAGPFCLRLARLCDRPALADLVVEQAGLIERHTRDEKNGLLRHAYDASRNAVWADKTTGRSPEIWGRAVGWFFAALADILEWLPPGHPGMPAVTVSFQNLADAVANAQDGASGLWYQVLDKGDRNENWLETSCSALFVYAFAKGLRTHRLAERFRANATRGLEGIISKTSTDADGRLEIGDICVGTGVGLYDHYIGRPRKTNDLHGVGAFILACAEMERLFAGNKGV